MPLRTSNESNIHRTRSGGVSNSHSPKLISKRRGSTSGGRGDHSQVQSQVTLNIDNNIHHGNNYTTNFRTNLPSDQSDDEITSNNNTCTKPKRAPLASRSEVLSYFGQESGGFKCKIFYRASKLSGSNLRKHLASSTHKIPNVLFKSQIEKVSQVIPPTISTERKCDLHTAAINCIIQDGLSFDTFQRPGMSKFLSTAIPGHKGPHRKTVRNRIAALYSAYTEKLRSLIPKLDLIALTSDLWKSP
ncbi:unnamed protein product [Didymodactylos carnosus]|uniref:Uncharacterized protein n=1 Tax=Didymodactylos carnosus TaxID=1234261 RepID=A0A815C1X9_9BILA|nr:unnamed protein product [Didymodactylos carnosus]CAF1301603.1 unnamed protein product [Didymodactylos carnosus]CAF4070784.1 unnamed protein product [Didymodactylos carnosus]CAF4108046.1 unnamed protein product [Didymodactylos carnosus]